EESWPGAGPGHWDAAAEALVEKSPCVADPAELHLSPELCLPWEHICSGFSTYF
ncbi:hypothetical protein EK904_013368, partial [Melospiza melodia maxima]